MLGSVKLTFAHGELPMKIVIIFKLVLKKLLYIRKLLMENSYDGKIRLH